MFSSVRFALRAQARRPRMKASMSSEPRPSASASLMSDLLKRPALEPARPAPDIEVDSMEPSPSVLDIEDDPQPPAGSYPPPNPPSPNPVNEAIKLGKDREIGAQILTEKYRLHVFASRNNTRATFTKGNGDTLAWASGGTCGFKGVNRASYEAGYQVAVKMFQAIQEERSKIKARTNMSIELFFKGFGQGRDAMYRALLTAEGTVAREVVAFITDRTPIKIGGTRAKKRRRL